MQTHNPLLALLALLSFLAPAWAQTAPLSYPFRLQTLVTRGAPHLADLWVSSYHTAAGQSDLVLVPNRTSAAQWFVTANSTLQLDRGGGGFAWNVVLAPSMGYAGWEVTTMRAGGKGTDGFGLAADAFGPLVLTWTTERMKAAANPTDDANQFFSWLGVLSFQSIQPFVLGSCWLTYPTCVGCMQSATGAMAFLNSSGASNTARCLQSFRLLQAVPK